MAASTSLRLATVAGLLAAIAGGLALAGCGDAGAPTNVGVCWRRPSAAGPKRAFVPVSNDVSTLDDCAALLEAYHLKGEHEVAGAFQGYFIFVDDRQIASSTQAGGFHFPIFQPGQRREIDADLIGLMRERGGAMPAPADIMVQRR